MTQRGYPGIHAGMPTAQCLRSAVVVNGAPRSKAKAKQSKAKQSESEAAWRSIYPSRPYFDPIVGASLLAMASVQTPHDPWRGSLLPLGCAAVAKASHAVCLEKCRGLLRRPAGASSLATLGGCGVEITDRPQSPCGSLLRAAIRRLRSIRCCLIRVVPRQLPLRHQYPVHPWNPVLSSQSYPSLVRPYSAKESAWLVPESNW